MDASNGAWKSAKLASLLAAGALLACLAAVPQGASYADEVLLAADDGAMLVGGESGLASVTANDDDVEAFDADSSEPAGADDLRAAGVLESAEPSGSDAEDNSKTSQTVQGQEDPDTSEASPSSDESGAPDESGTSDTQDTSDESDTPVNPDDPGNPDDPDNPDTPDNPDDPENPDDPGAPDDPDDPEPVQHADGWERDGKVWHYWLDGKMVVSDWVVTKKAPKGIDAPTGKQRYWIDGQGALARNRWIATKKTPFDFGVAAGKHRYWVSGQGVLVLGQWVHTKQAPFSSGMAAGKHHYWVDDQGVLTLGQWVGTTQAPFSSGIAEGNHSYWVNDHGVLVRGKWVATKKVPGESEKAQVKQHYWVAKKGVMAQSSWVDTKKNPGFKNAPVGEHRYWVDKTGALARKRLINPDTANDAGAYFAYASKYGFIVTGKHKVGNLVYLARKSGRLESGDENGFLTRKKYDEGALHTYRISPKEHAVITGKVVNVKGWGKLYSLPKVGYMLQGLTPSGSKHMILATPEGKLFQKSGWAKTDWFAGSKQLYYLEPVKNGKLQAARTGMFSVDGLQYQADSNGVIFRNGAKFIDGKYYNADGNGVLTYNYVVTRMHEKAQGYSSPSQYLIMVDTDDTKTIVFEGYYGHWDIKYVWDCSTGAPETPTVLGVYQVGLRGYSFGEDHGYSCYYWTQFYGDYLFHTRIYWANTHDLRDASMNAQTSQGCVRLYDEDAYWIWQNVPSGTTVVTMR